MENGTFALVVPCEISEFVKGGRTRRSSPTVFIRIDCRGYIRADVGISPLQALIEEVRRVRPMCRTADIEDLPVFRHKL